MRIDRELAAQDLQPAIERMWARSADVLDRLERRWDPAGGSPVFTVDGRYASRGWTEWTQGFQFGSLLLQFDATGDRAFLESGCERIIKFMAPHVSHIGVHDHGFNNVSTYGNLRRLILEGRAPREEPLLGMCELALRVSGAVQAARWTKTADGNGFIYSFNGPHSLFCDTIRSLRSLAIAHRLGHRLMIEHDQPVSLLERLVQHVRTTIRYAVYFGEGRDIYDVRGRVAHESLFNVIDGHYRAPATQQGYSPFSTWMRGLGWILLGCAELAEFVADTPADHFDATGGRADVEEMLVRGATATADFYLENTASDGVPYWDAGAPGLNRLGDWKSRLADPLNDHEPVDSSAAAIACQGLLRLGEVLNRRGEANGEKYSQAGLTVLRTLLGENWLSAGSHEGLLLHSVYHRPAGWDFIPAGRRVPCGEASQWGDYHLREAALIVQRRCRGEAPYRFDTPRPATNSDPPLGSSLTPE